MTLEILYVLLFSFPNYNAVMAALTNYFLSFPVNKLKMEIEKQNMGAV